jgi:shikimate dehydrogenase
MRNLKLGLLGNNIEKSQSKKLHELIGSLYGINATYELMDLSDKKTTINDELLRCQAEGFDGVNVTHPYKIDAFNHVNLMNGFPRGLTSINTVIFKDNILADNTDYLGFVQAYQEKFNNKNPGKVLMLGAGGVGLAIGFGLLKLKASELVIFDTNQSYAKTLVSILNSNGLNSRLAKEDLIDEINTANGLINATPIGMFQYPGNPFPDLAGSSAEWSFDAVYTPVRTEFIKSCEKNNIDFISGFKLFLHQGVEGFKRFSGIEVDGQLIEQKFSEKYPL